MEGSKLNKSQSKYYNTACLMDEALILLLDKKEYTFITVKEICEKAGVNRSTFYLHYETIDDLLSETIEYIGENIRHQYENEQVIDIRKINSCPIEDLLLITPKYLIPYLEFTKSKKQIFKTAYTQPNVLKNQDIVNRLYKILFEPILIRFKVFHRRCVCLLCDCFKFFNKAAVLTRFRFWKQFLPSFYFFL